MYKTRQLYEQPTPWPTRKIGAVAAVGVPLATVLVWFFGLFELTIPPEVAAALAALIAALVGYFVRDHVQSVIKALFAAILVLPLFGCDTLVRGLDYCDQAAGAVELICSGIPPLIPAGAGGGELTDPANPDCVVLTSADSVPIEYCRAP